MKKLCAVFALMLVVGCAAPKAPEPTGTPFPINPVLEVEHVKIS